MRLYLSECTVFLLLLTLCHSALLAAEPAAAPRRVTADNYVAPTDNVPDEPITSDWSVGRAADFLDAASLHWQDQHGCMTCHTNYASLYARPSISADAPAHGEVRRFAEELVQQRWQQEGPRWDAEVVATAAALAFNDAATAGRLQPATRIALDRMWTIQREDGGWDWLKCGWPPLESDDHYGVTMAAIAIGVAPDNYVNSAAAQVGLSSMRKYFRDNPPQTLHHRAMLVWADSYLPDLISDEQRKACLDDLLEQQQPDGGWAIATLGDWQRHDESAQDTTTSDGYGTGFVLYVLRRGGLAEDVPAIQRGIAWLKANQRESGRWFTRSLTDDDRHYISHAGTALAVMALAACGELAKP